MEFVNVLIKVATGSVAGVAAITALPVFGAVGAITSTGVVAGSVIGAIAGVIDEIKD